jgi:hypothetical protein
MGRWVTAAPAIMAGPVRAAGKKGTLEGCDLGRIMDIAVEWPEAQPGETLLERQCGALLKARLDNVKKGTSPRVVMESLHRWISADIASLTTANAEPLLPKIVGVDFATEPPKTVIFQHGPRGHLAIVDEVREQNGPGSLAHLLKGEND